MPTRKKRKRELPISAREVPPEPAWINQPTYLLEVGARSVKTETTYRSGLRLFADWIQHYGLDSYALEDPWPLSPNKLSTSSVLRFRTWLLANRSQSTATTYLAAVTGYLHFLDGLDQLPETVQLGKLQRQLTRRQIDRNLAENVIDMDAARQAMPRIIEYYNDLPVPSSDDKYGRRLSLCRDRAVVCTLYSTAARLSEIIGLNRSNVDHGRAKFAAITGKGGKSRTIYIRSYARQAIKAYLAVRTDSNPALFVAHSRNARNARLSATSAHSVVKKAVKALNLHPSLSAHDFRHYRATQLLREGMPLEVVQEFLGHSDISTTRGIYAPVLGIHIVSEWLDNLDISPQEAASSLTPRENDLG